MSENTQMDYDLYDPDGNPVATMNFQLYDEEGDPLAMLTGSQVLVLRRLKLSFDLRPYHNPETQENKHV